MPAPSSISRAAATLLAALALCLPAAWNGQPLFYPDTPTYLRGAETGVARIAPTLVPAPWVTPELAAPAQGTHTVTERRAGPGLTSVDDKIVLAGRSVYYGAFLWLAHTAGSLWWAVALQALCVAWVLQLLVLRLWGLGPPTLVAGTLLLAITTPLGAYTGLLMPDVLAGTAVLIVAALAVHWRRLRRGERWALAALLLFALCAHASHVVIASALLLLALALRRYRADWQGLSGPGLAVVAACIAGAVGAEWGFAQAVERSVGAPPLRLPHPMARLVDEGPGSAFLRRTCPQSGYAACAFVDNFPTPWTDFLFSTDPQRGAFALANPATKRQMAAEQGRFVRDVLRDDPGGVLGGLAKDVARQLALFRVDIWGYGEREIAMYVDRVPEPVLAGMQASRCAGTRRCNEALSLATYVAVLGSAALGLHAFRRRLRAAPACLPQRFEQVMWLALAGVFFNAVACATLASPMDRFQARIVWLLPFLALSAGGLAVSAARTHRRQRMGTVPLQGATP